MNTRPGIKFVHEGSTPPRLRFIGSILRTAGRHVFPWKTPTSWTRYARRYAPGILATASRLAQVYQLTPVAARPACSPIRRAALQRPDRVVPLQHVSQFVDAIEQALLGEAVYGELNCASAGQRDGLRRETHFDRCARRLHHIPDGLELIS
jgi:hypothetical protein